jgi:hypothetical protein
MGINYAKLFANNMSSVIKQNAWVEKAKVKNKIDKLESTDLWTLKWIWDTTVKQLLENWISSLEELKEAWVRKVNNLKLNPFSLRAIKEFLQSK